MLAFWIVGLHGRLVQVYGLSERVHTLHDQYVHCDVLSSPNFPDLDLPAQELLISK